ncbi:hypothetical protein QBC38DRAFT_66199 [Podospora fimiseda]|uniref:Nephrocystin 3-like N-terminal domain-containing protein n=1 Tax=Podospora fimiseda TaxID=252190 RepID=A0AAN7BGB8_9PEZI|nr:hypothetical protein QBC38DRAFT_66199 [Podospora fimiseda]
MADSLTAFSIASGVAQIVSLSGDIFKSARTIGEKGSPDPTLADKAIFLSKLSENLQKDIRGLQPIQLPSQNPGELLQVCEQCLRAARLVTEEFSQLKRKSVATTGSSSTTVLRGKIPQALKLVFGEKSKIDKLEKQMGREEQSLQSGLVSELWFSRLDAQQATQVAQFKNCNPELQHFIKQWSDGDSKLIALITNTTNDFKEESRIEHSKTRDALASHLKTHESSQHTRAQYDQLMNSLDFGLMNRGRNALRCAHKETFKWFFVDRKRNSWSSFLEWLKSGEKVYWIFGKAGSGKSTLMKYLVEDPTSLKHLQNYGRQTLILSFFLWSVGSIEQRNVHGLLCSLLHQILTEAPDIGGLLLSSQPDIRQKKNITDWSVQSLKKALFCAIAAFKRTVAYFLMGLTKLTAHVAPLIS